MKGETPVFKRCCFCLPLRYGLLAWGYLKMIADATLFLIITFILKDTLMMISAYEREDHVSWIYKALIVEIIAITIFFTDFIVTIVFIVGGHKKNVKLIRVFYIVSIGIWVINCLLTAIQVVTAIQNLMVLNHNSHPITQVYWVRVVVPPSCFFVVLAVQSYFLLLLRSEMIRLRNNGEFRFVKNAAEAECAMICEETAVGEETVKKVVIN